MKNLLRDVLQILAALLLTTSIALVMKVPVAATPRLHPVITPKVVKTMPQSQIAVTAPPAPPQCTLTIHECWMALAGIAESDWPAVDYIVSHESHWCPTVWEGEVANPCPAFHGVSNYDGYGLCQSTPPQKMAAAGADWQTSPVTQLEWCSTHAVEYGGWWAAYSYWLVHHNW